MDSWNDGRARIRGNRLCPRLKYCIPLGLSSRLSWTDAQATRRSVLVSAGWILRKEEGVWHSGIGSVYEKWVRRGPTDSTGGATQLQPLLMIWNLCET